MDIVSHAFAGATIGATTGATDRRPDAWCAVFAAMPDFLQALFLYPYVGYMNGRPWLVPYHADWEGFRDENPIAAAIWELPHSGWFVLLVIWPLVRAFRLPPYCTVAYASHLVLDILTHTGEWSVAPLWPIPWRLEGYADPWAWSPVQWMQSIVAMAVLYGLTRMAVRSLAPSRVESATRREL